MSGHIRRRRAQGKPVRAGRQARERELSGDPPAAMVESGLHTIPGEAILARLNISEAAFSGFGVIKRSPLAPAVWGLLRMALVAGPMLLILPIMLEMFATILPATARGEQPDMDANMSLQGQMGLIWPLSFVCSLAAQGLVTGAIFRAVLQPNERSWFHLRVGLAEVMLIAINIVFTVMLIIALVLAVVLVAILSGIAFVAAKPAGIIVGIVAGLAAIGVLIWGALRYSLAWGLSFENRSFLLFESWPLTKGQSGRLFLMGLINVIIACVLEVIFGGVAFGILGVAMAGAAGFSPEALEDPGFYTGETFRQLLPWVIGILAVSGVLSGYLLTFITAPWAQAYAQLRPEDAEAA
jgi:hypothetical protein